jgi:putative cell wall-binding protein
MRLGSRAWAVVAVAAAFVAIMTVPAGRATPSFSFTRLAGVDRYGTAAKIATETYGASPVAVLTTGERFPDALAGAYVAGVSRSPIVLTRHAALPDATAQALQTMRTGRVVIVGGSDAVSAEVEADLQDRGITTSRIAGADRYGTAAAAAGSAGPIGPGSVGGSRTAIVASGENFPDALAAGPLSYANRLPILLTPRTSLADATRDSLSSLAIQQVLIPGGVAAVSAGVQQTIEQMGISVIRIAGEDRTDTAARLADWAIANASFSRTHANLARGNDFADALAGGPHAGSDGPAPILLTLDQSSLGGTTRNWFTAHAPTLESGHVFGGTAAVGAAVEADATNAARGSGSATTTTGPPPTSPYFTNWRQIAGSTSQLDVVYDEPITCSSVDANGSNYTVTIVAGPGSPATVQPTGAECVSPTLGSSDTVRVTLPAGTLRQKQDGRVTAVVGGDGDTVQDAFSRRQQTGNAVRFVIE